MLCVDDATRRKSLLCAWRQSAVHSIGRQYRNGSAVREQDPGAMPMRLPSPGLRNPGARLLLAALFLLAMVWLILLAADSQSSWAQSPFGAAARGSPETGFVGWVMAKQAIFYRALSGAVRAAK